jgi:hypothetical protein
MGADWLAEMPAGNITRNSLSAGVSSSSPAALSATHSPPFLPFPPSLLPFASLALYSCVCHAPTFLQPITKYVRPVVRPKEVKQTERRTKGFTDYRKFTFT